MRPRVSVVIPTAGRPQMLPRAVDSALACGPAGAVEVIVVPNGPDESWKVSLARFAADPCVRIEPRAERGANAARNHGLALARATYVRFLDDDDYLHGRAAARQLELLERAGADVCSGAMEIVDEDGTVLAIVGQPAGDDLVAATLAPGRLTSPQAHVFRASALPPSPWSPDVPVRQDIEFMINVVVRRELRWVTVTEATGAWVQHRRARTSRPYKQNADHHLMLRWLDGAARTLEEQHRLHDNRRRALGFALADTAHKAFPLAPWFWSSVLRRAQRLAPQARPQARLLGMDPFAVAPTLLVEWALLPVRWLTTGARRARAALGLAPWSRSHSGGR